MKPEQRLWTCEGQGGLKLLFNDPWWARNDNRNNYMTLSVLYATFYFILFKVLVKIERSMSVIALVYWQLWFRQQKAVFVELILRHVFWQCSQLCFRRWCRMRGVYKWSENTISTSCEGFMVTSCLSERHVWLKMKSKSEYGTWAKKTSLTPGLALPMSVMGFGVWFHGA